MWGGLVPWVQASRPCSVMVVVMSVVFGAGVVGMAGEEQGVGVGVGVGVPAGGVVDFAVLAGH